jgi:hypothetical protein
MEGSEGNIQAGMKECLMPDLERVGIYLWTGDPKTGGRKLSSIIGIIEYGMKKDPYSGDVYVFRTSSKTEVFAYRWAGDGWCEWKKRNIGTRTYYWPEGNGKKCTQISALELHLLLKGINLWKRHPVYDGQHII